MLLEAPALMPFEKDFVSSIWKHQLNWLVVLHCILVSST